MSNFNFNNFDGVQETSAYTGGGDYFDTPFCGLVAVVDFKVRETTKGNQELKFLLSNFDETQPENAHGIKGKLGETNLWFTGETKNRDKNMSILRCILQATGVFDSFVQAAQSLAGFEGSPVEEVKALGNVLLPLIKGRRFAALIGGSANVKTDNEGNAYIATYCDGLYTNAFPYVLPADQLPTLQAVFEKIKLSMIRGRADAEKELAKLQGGASMMGLPAKSAAPVAPPAMAAAPPPPPPPTTIAPNAPNAPKQEQTVAPPVAPPPPAPAAPAAAAPFMTPPPPPATQS